MNDLTDSHYKPDFEIADRYINQLVLLLRSRRVPEARDSAEKERLACAFYSLSLLKSTPPHFSLITSFTLST